MTTLSVNTTSSLVYLNCVFGSDFIFVMTNTHLPMTFALDKDTKQYDFVLFSMQCSSLFLISSVCKNQQDTFLYCVLYSFSCHEREYYVFIRLCQEYDLKFTILLQQFYYFYLCSTILFLYTHTSPLRVFSLSLLRLSYSAQGCAVFFQQLL